MPADLDIGYVRDAVAAVYPRPAHSSMTGPAARHIGIRLRVHDPLDIPRQKSLALFLPVAVAVVHAAHAADSVAKGALGRSGGTPACVMSDRAGGAGRG
jgi:hypothetical protein